MPRYKDRPCPGCGELRPLAPQTICGNCRHLLEKAHRDAARRAEELSAGEKITIALGDAWRVEGGLFDLSFPGKNDSVSRITRAMAAATGTEKLRHSDLRARVDRCVHYSAYDLGDPVGGYRLVTPAQADALQDLGDAIVAYVSSMVQAARKGEQSFLVKLASGEATVQDYEKRVIK